ncbi:MAG: addiction module protein [Planctomycetes bacterium]|nr:addiction module protein [Planctomycetota bacterium]
MTSIEIKKMPTIERLRAMEELWDALCHEDKEIDSPEWHGTILENRRKKIETGKAEFISIEELTARGRK